MVNIAWEKTYGCSLCGKGKSVVVKVESEDGELKHFVCLECLTTLVGFWEHDKELLDLISELGG